MRRLKNIILRRLKKIKHSSGLVKSLKSDTDNGLSSCSNFPERPTLEKMEMDKPVLPEIEHVSGKVTDEQLEAIKDVLERNADVFSTHKADIECCNFVEHEIELEESAVPHREGARRMTPHKSDACRKEIKTLLEHDMLEPLVREVLGQCEVFQHLRSWDSAKCPNTGARDLGTVRSVPALEREVPGQWEASQHLSRRSWDSAKFPNT